MVRLTNQTHRHILQIKLSPFFHYFCQEKEKDWLVEYPALPGKNMRFDLMWQWCKHYGKTVCRDVVVCKWNEGIVFLCIFLLIFTGCLAGNQYWSVCWNFLPIQEWYWILLSPWISGGMWWFLCFRFIEEHVHSPCILFLYILAYVRIEVCVKV